MRRMFGFAGYHRAGTAFGIAPCKDPYGVRSYPGGQGRPELQLYPQLRRIERIYGVVAAAGKSEADAAEITDNEVILLILRHVKINTYQGGRSRGGGYAAVFS